MKELILCILILALCGLGYELQGIKKEFKTLNKNIGMAIDGAGLRPAGSKENKNDNTP